MSQDPKAKYPLKSLQRALHILDALGRSAQGTTISELSEEFSIGKSTVHRFLSTLHEFGLVWFDPRTSTYALGSKIQFWNALLVRQNLLLQHGMSILKDLVNRCGETANLAVLEGTEIFYIAQLESMEHLRMSGALGNRTPAHCTALGKALLATLSDQEFEERYHNAEVLVSLTPNSITDKQQLREQIQKVRQDGIAYDFEEHDIGGVCGGAAVKNFTGQSVAAISVSLPVQRARREKLISVKEDVLAAARQLSHELGYHPGVVGLLDEVRDSAAIK